MRDTLTLHPQKRYYLSQRLFQFRLFLFLVAGLLLCKSSTVCASICLARLYSLKWFFLSGVSSRRLARDERTVRGNDQ